MSQNPYPDRNSAGKETRAKNPEYFKFHQFKAVDRMTNFLVMSIHPTPLGSYIEIGVYRSYFKHELKEKIGRKTVTRIICVYVCKKVSEDGDACNARTDVENVENDKNVTQQQIITP
uniref:Uncharacterized protein n=1 Tax=Panagrolaimus sp. ES5 TaxID=591445 RepID=A0AC34FZ70_9BILA